MNTNDLMSEDVIREAMQCPVCQREGKTLKEIQDCLKSHGIHRCFVCFNTYLSKEDWGLHLNQCHKNGRGRLVCPICKSFRMNAGKIIFLILKVIIVIVS